MKAIYLFIALSVLAATPARADLRQLVDETTLHRIAAETSGEMAKRNLDAIAVHHRMRASEQFAAATRHVEQQLEGYGLESVEILRYAADGKTMFGTQKSRPVWRVRFAELWEVERTGDGTRRVRRLGDWGSVPLTLAQDSLSADVTAALVDVGAGTSPADYEGRDVRGKLVLTSSQPGAIVDLAVGERGAAGIVSYAPNQRSAWWKEDDRLVRWGHVGSFPKTKSFGFMVSLGEARKLQQRLAAGEEILFHAKVDASHEEGHYEFVTAEIEGTDRKDEIIHYTCHLDHPRPGANDNVSGCVAILETARTLSALIANGTLPRPRRTLKFLWPAEIEGSIMYLAGFDDPSRIKANIHMDMVGGAPVTKAVFRISGGPYSVPSFIADLGHEIGHFINDQTRRFADGEDVAFPLHARDGGKEPLLAQMEGLDMGSDHDVFFEGTWRIPGLYLHDWPDRYIHTNFDTAANIDPTKLKRAAFIGAVSGWFLANMSEENVPAVLDMLKRNALQRGGEHLARRATLPALDAAASTEVHFDVERRKVDSIRDFAAVSGVQRDAALRFLGELQKLFAMPVPAIFVTRDETVYVRNPAAEGPMHAFGYSYIEDKLGAGKLERLRLPKHSTTFGTGIMFTYEALNFVDGERTVSDIRDWLLAELGDVPVEYVAEYLDALESIDVIRKRQR
ncbi:MAG TPA: M28 family peptidase [Woeseiaceae bacterium]|nr:M28 family peptidase [Woeseiaceae bacterium]